MKRNDVVRAAVAAGFKVNLHSAETFETVVGQFEMFAEMVAKAKREEHAQICDELAEFLYCHLDKDGSELCKSLADSIRNKKS